MHDCGRATVTTRRRVTLGKETKLQSLLLDCQAELLQMHLSAIGLRFLAVCAPAWMSHVSQATPCAAASQPFGSRQVQGFDVHWPQSELCSELNTCRSVSCLHCYLATIIAVSRSCSVVLC